MFINPLLPSRNGRLWSRTWFPAHCAWQACRTVEEFLKLNQAPTERVQLVPSVINQSEVGEARTVPLELFFRGNYSIRAGYFKLRRLRMIKTNGTTAPNVPLIPAPKTVAPPPASATPASSTPANPTPPQRRRDHRPRHLAIPSTAWTTEARSSTAANSSSDLGAGSAAGEEGERARGRPIVSRASQDQFKLDDSMKHLRDLENEESKITDKEVRKKLLEAFKAKPPKEQKLLISFIKDNKRAEKREPEQGENGARRTYENLRQRINPRVTDDDIVEYMFDPAGRRADALGEYAKQKGRANQKKIDEMERKKQQELDFAAEQDALAKMVETANKVQRLPIDPHAVP